MACLSFSKLTNCKAQGFHLAIKLQTRKGVVSINDRDLASHHFSNFGYPSSFLGSTPKGVFNQKHIHKHQNH